MVPTPTAKAAGNTIWTRALREWDEKEGPVEAAHFSIRECGGGGDCMFHVLAYNWNTMRLPNPRHGGAPWTAQHVRDEVARLLDYRDVDPAPGSLYHSYLSEWQNDRRLGVRSSVDWIANLIRAETDEKRLQELRNVVRKMGWTYQGDEETLKVLMRPGGVMRENRVGILVLMDDRTRASAVCQYRSPRDLIPVGTRYLTLILQRTGPRGAGGHWQTVLYNGQPFVEIGNVPKGLRVLIEQACGNPVTYYRVYAPEELAALDCSRHPLTYEEFQGMMNTALDPAAQITTLRPLSPLPGLSEEDVQEATQNWLVNFLPTAPHRVSVNRADFCRQLKQRGLFDEKSARGDLSLTEEWLGQGYIAR
jgi:hypothetical protein